MLSCVQMKILLWQWFPENVFDLVWMYLVLRSYVLPLLRAMI